MNTSIELGRHEYMPVWTFRMMLWSMKFRDLFSVPSNKLNDFGIKAGDVVIDYGCGPGRYLKKASQLAGSEGTVYAVDIHDMAMKCVNKLKKKKKLSNIYPKKAKGYFVAIQENKADLIYALDIFHMISQPNEFLNEIHRLVKPNGTFILEDGHQKRSKTLEKVKSNKRWTIQTENKNHLILIPKFKLKQTP